MVSDAPCTYRYSKSSSNLLALLFSLVGALALLAIVDIADFRDPLVARSAMNSPQAAGTMDSQSQSSLEPAKLWASMTGGLNRCPLRFREELSRYSQWHTDTLSSMHRLANESNRQDPEQKLPRTVPVIIFVCLPGDLCGGLGDRFTGLIQLFYFALRFKALFFVDMPSIHQAVLPASFDWRYDTARDVLQRFSAPEDSSELLTDINCLKHCRYFGGRKEINAAILGNSSIRVMSNRGLFFFSNRARYKGSVGEIGLDPNTWGCMYRAILTPSPLLLRLIATDLVAMQNARAVVCIHLRVGDDVMRLAPDAIESSPPEALLAGLDCVGQAFKLLNSTETEAKSSELIWQGLSLFNGSLLPSQSLVILASDSQYVKSNGASLLRLPGGTMVRSVAVKSSHVDSVATRNLSTADDSSRATDTLREWFTLAACPVWAGSMASGFSRTAAVYGLTMHVLTNMAQFKERKNVSCDGFFPLSRFFPYAGSSGA